MLSCHMRTGSLASLCLLIIASTGASSVARAGESGAFRDFKIGQQIEIKAKPSKSGNLVATSVEIGKPYKIEGQIEAIDGGNYTLTVVGVKILSDYKAKVRDSEGMPMEFSDLRVGQTVKVGGDMSPAGVYQAAKIKLERDDYKVEGKIQVIDESEMSLTVLGLQSIASLNSQIVDPDGAPVEFSSLRRGQMVQVKGTVRPDGVLQVKKIKVRGPGKTKLRVEGVIQEIDDAKGTLTLMGISVAVNKKAKIEFR